MNNFIAISWLKKKRQKMTKRKNIPWFNITAYSKSSKFCIGEGGGGGGVKVFRLLDLSSLFRGGGGRDLWFRHWRCFADDAPTVKPFFLFLREVKGKLKHAKQESESYPPHINPKHGKPASEHVQNVLTSNLLRTRPYQRQSIRHKKWGGLKFWLYG